MGWVIVTSKLHTSGQALLERFQRENIHHDDTDVFTLP